MRVLSFFWLSLAVTVLGELQIPLSPPQGKKRLSFSDVLSGKLRPESTTLQWTSTTGKDGAYIETNKTTGDLWLAHVLEEKQELLVNGTKLAQLLAEKTGQKSVAVHEYKIQPGGRKLLLSANYTKLYRWSGFADFYIYDPESDTAHPLDTTQAGDIRYATWSKTGDSIAYVKENNLYVYLNEKNTRITNDGSPDVFNGVPDWVYEEEIFSSTNTLWYSPDGRYVAFLRFNETGVPTYRVPYYMTGSKATACPRELELRYPKAGQTNPTVSLHLLDLQDLGKGAREVKVDAFTPENLIIGEVSWVTDTHNYLAWRCFNRVQDHDKLMTLEVPTGRTFVAAERDEKNGWLDDTQSIRNVPHMNSYVYLSDEDGWSHLYLQYVNGTKPLQLTKGDWEVTQILHVTADKVYFQSTERHSTERHLYSLDFYTLEKIAMVDDKRPGYYSASFSSQGGYYVLSTSGPDLPRQAVYSVDVPGQKLFSSEDTTKPIKILQDNKKLADALSSLDLPTTTWSTMKVADGFELNVLETRPPNFDATKKYPLLLNPYGGPGSQQTAKSFRGADWWAYLASDPGLEYIILTVDGRGTGFKGRAFRSVVTGNLGYYEALDQISAAKTWAKRSYIDSSKIIIQGWSYGGYLSSKVIEQDSDVFSSAIITAPVSSWEFYDSFYTERYMKSPRTNSNGYYNSSVHNTTGFNNARGGVLLQHGTGDDNVHFQNSAVLVDLLMTGGVAVQNSSVARGLRLDDGIFCNKFDSSIPFPARESVEITDQEYFGYLLNGSDSNASAQRPVSPSKLTVQWFTDSDHGISFHGSTLFLRKQMAGWLYREKRRRERTTADKEESEWLQNL